MYNQNFYILSQVCTFFKDILLPCFNCASIGFQLASLMRNEKDKEEFKNDIEMLSKTAKAIDELLKTTMEEREDWLELQDNFEKDLKRF